MRKFLFFINAVFLSFAPSAYGQAKTLIIESTPNAAKVKLGEFESGRDILDGTEKRLYQTCVTPCSLSLTRSKYDVWIEKDGYSPVRYNWTDKSTDINQISHSGTVIKHKIVLLTEAQTKQRRIDSKLRRECPEKYKVYENLDDTDAVFCKRSLPRFRNTLKKDATCTFVFDVTIEGSIENLRDVDCSKKKLKSVVSGSVPYWTYLPAKLNGLPIDRLNVKSSMTFKANK